MCHPIRSGRIGMLAVGLSIGAALASTPQIASADPSADPFSWADQVLSGLAVPADPTSPLDMQISISGLDLFSTVDNTATANSGFGDIAIAIGNGAVADTSGGVLNFAFADGTNTFADTPVGADLDFALADGAGSSANVGLGANLDNAIALGTGSAAIVGVGSSLTSAFAD